MAGSLFQSDRICLQPFEAEDAPALGAYLNHPELAGRRYIPWKCPEVAPLSQKQVQGIVEEWSETDRELHLAITGIEEHELLGHAECDLSWDPHCPTVSVVIDPAQQRKGYGSEALSLLLRYLFEQTPAHVVACWVGNWNLPALRFAARHGFREAGRMRRAGIRQGQYYDVIVSDLLRSEWQGSGGDRHAP